MNPLFEFFHLFVRRLIRVHLDSTAVVPAAVFPLVADLDDLLQASVAVNDAKRLADVEVQSVEDGLVVNCILLVHIHDLCHVPKQLNGVLVRPVEEQIVHVVNEELQVLVFEHGLLHIREDLPEASQMLIHGRYRVQSVLSHGDADLELSVIRRVAEDTTEFAFRLEHELEDLVAPVAEHEVKQLVVVLVPELLQSVFVLNLGLLLAFLVELHDWLLMDVHLVENIVLDCIFAGLLVPVIVFPDFLLQVDHELLDLRQEVLHALFVSDQRRLAALLQSLRLLLAVSHLRSDLNQP